MFGKKTAEDVLKLFSQLSDEEKAKVLEGLKQPENEEPAAEPETGEQAEETAEENETPAQTTEDGGENSADGQEPPVGNEDSPPAEEVVADGGEAEEGAPPATEAAEAADTAETVGEEAATETAAEPPADAAADEVDYGEVTQALAARLSSLEEKFSAMEQKLADEVEKDNNQDFGSSPSLPTPNDGNSRLAEVMNNYAGANARRYY